ncbi:MAG: YebC/PmpR family DNA-binding transcriptional regulator [Myxococcales bacterium]|nr:YebC/PmpR family DNA-binding transcriptional regulator [Myxococcales bacterium]
MSGHSRWSTIKRKKGAADAKKGKAWTKLIKEITVAARLGGGDANGNPRLRKAVDTARAENMPTDNIQKAIKRGTGELEGVAYEELTYEGTGPGGTLFIIEALTDNRNRTVAEIRKIFEKCGAVLGTSNTASWAFDRQGQIRLAKKAATEEQLFEVALGAGAEDLVDVGDEWLVSTGPSVVDVVRGALEEAKIEVKSSQLAQVAKNVVQIEGKDAEQVLRLIDVLEDHDDVQNVFANFDLTEDELARLEG